MNGPREELHKTVFRNPLGCISCGEVEEISKRKNREECCAKQKDGLTLRDGGGEWVNRGERTESAGGKNYFCSHGASRESYGN